MSGDTRGKWIKWTLIVFGVFVLTLSIASNRHERILYSTLPIAAALMCLGRFAWVYGEIVIERQFYERYGRRFTGRAALPFGYGFKAWAAASVLMAAWVIAIFLRELL